VCAHLVGLHLAPEGGLSTAEVPPRLQRLASSVREWPHLEPPADGGPLTVFDVAAAAAREEHAARVRAWALQEWRVRRAHRREVVDLARSWHAVGTRG
jgi:hypothetical protein